MKSSLDYVCISSYIEYLWSNSENIVSMKKLVLDNHDLNVLKLNGSTQLAKTLFRERREL